MAARLLDNEALGADYQVATVEDILRDHVAPTALRPCGGAAAGAGLLGGRGSSEWRVVYEFCRYYGELPPV